MTRPSRPMGLPDAMLVDRRAPEPEKWHLSKNVPISLIVTLLVIAFSGVQAFFKHERDIDLLKAAQVANYSTLREADATQTNQFRDALTLLREQYRSLDQKIDRLIERDMEIKKSH